MPAPETARGRGKSGVRSQALRLGALGVYAAGVTLGSAALAAGPVPPQAGAKPAGGSTLDVNALPSGGKVLGATSTINQSGNTLTVNQSASRSIINWDSYNIGSQASVVYVQPGADAVSLNRVVGNEASQIYGRLEANGQVFLINGNGVLFGKGAQVNVNGLLASTLDLDDADFGAGRLRFSGHGGSVRNDGHLTADDGGYIALLGGQVDNRGLITARLGSVLLGAGDAATLDFNGDGLLSVALDAGAAHALVDNSGSLSADGGRVQLSARAADRVMASLVNNSGHVEARGLVVRNGVIELTGDIVDNGGLIAANGAQGGEVNVHATSILQHGVIQADGSVGAGGTVALHATQALLQTASGHVSADGASVGGEVLLDGGGLAYLSGQVSADGASGGHLVASATTLTVGGARLSADGVNQGGSILLGGDLHGGHAGMVGLGNARTTRVTTGSTLSAAGSGGRIVVWSDGDTAYGGAAHTGPAGTIEVSAKQQLSYSGTADAGKGGHVLLDPFDLVIGTSTPTSYIDLAAEAPAAGDQHGSGGVVDLGVIDAVPTVVVASPQDSFGGAPGAGSVYVYNTANGALISHLYGTHAGDAVGSQGITVLAGSSNFVIASPQWNNAAGAVTWGSATTGVSGEVSALNSLVGSTPGDMVGLGGVVALANGHYAVASPQWSNPLDPADTGYMVGAVTWGDGVTGTVGAVGTDNSLHGSTAFDQVGVAGVTALVGNGNFVIASPNWSDPVDPQGAGSSVGAVTWVDGNGPSSGPVTAANSLIGSHAGDLVGQGGVTALTNGNFVVDSYFWNSNAGAVTWGDGLLGLANTVVDAGNSLVGKPFDPATDFGGDLVGFGGVVALANGNYVVSSPYWSPDTLNNVTQVGAVTWGDGLIGSLGEVVPANSLVGSSSYDNVGLGATNLLTGVTSGGVVALPDGNYVVVSPNWSDGPGLVLAAGAVTWRDGLAASGGVAVGADNSLIGSKAQDRVGNGGVVPLDLGRYVVVSHQWSLDPDALTGAPAVAEVGAVTFVDPALPARGAGVVSAANSLVGSSEFDHVGFGSNGVDGVVALKLGDQASGNYVVVSPDWQQPAAGLVPAAQVGAVTWGSGDGSSVGAVNAGNSLVGSTTGDRIGSGGVVALTNGNYVVASPQWSNADPLADGTPNLVANVGAVTWRDGGTANPDVVSTTNSLHGSSSGDRVGNGGADMNFDLGAGFAGAGVVALSNGNYVVVSPNWSNAEDPTNPIGSVGAVTWRDGYGPSSGAVGSTNSLIGASAFDYLGASGITPLATGDYAITSPFFSKNGLVSSGAVWVASGSPDSNLQASSIAVAVDQTLTLQADHDITVNAPVRVDGTLVLDAGNDITLNAAIESTQQNATSLIVHAGNAFINNAGPDALLTDVSSVWQVWSIDPANDVRGGLVYDFKQYDAVYGAATVQGLGNGIFYSVAPVLDATLAPAVGASVAKVYDGNTAADAAQFRLGANGLIDGDIVDLASTTIDYASKNVGAGLDVIASGITLTGVSDGGRAVPVYGYRLSPTSETAVAVAAGQITPAQLTVLGTTVTTRAYDGSVDAQVSGTLTGLVNGESLTFTQTGTFDSANAGTRNVAVANAVTDNGAVLASNYNLVNPTENLTGQIDKATLTATNTAAATKTYDGNTTAAITGTLSGLVNGETAVFSQSGTFDSANAGVRTVAVANSVAFTGSALADNYTLVNPTENIAGQIDKATLTATNTAAATKTYDGNTTAAITGTLAGLVNGETAGFSQSGTFDSANAGARTVAVANAVAFTGSALADNYTLVNPTQNVAGQIDKATLTAINTAAATKTYDGNTTAAVTGTLAGLVNGETAGFSQSGTFDSANAGARTVAVANTVAFTGSALADNYTLVNPTQSVAGQIDKATLTATNTAAASKTYDGNATAAITGTLAGLVNGETAAFSQSGTFDSANAGTRTVAVANTVAFTGSALADNYTLVNPTQSVAGQIDKATLTATNTAAATKTYDGNTTAAITGTLSGLVNGETAGFSQSGAFDSANAGVRTVAVANTVAFTGSALADNYTLANPTENVAGQIDKASLTATNTAAATKTYDGNTTAAITGTLSGLVNGETAGFSQSGTFDSANAGARAVAVANAVAFTGSALADNYTLVNPTENVAGRIDKATLTATNTAAATKTYDGNTTAAITGTLAGLVNGETAGFSQSGTFDSANAGARTVAVANTVAFTGSALADNYSLVNPAQAVASQIDKATLTAINTAAATKTYDGNTTAAITGTLAGLVNGETAAFSQSGTFDSANAGTRTVAVANTVAFTGSALADNYTLVNPTQSVAGQIDKATLTATNTAAATKTYDGNTTAAITGTLSGLVNGETAGFIQSGTFDSANAGARTVAVTNAVAFTGSALADNYTLVNPTQSVAGQIDKTTLTATNTAAATKTYDGNTTAAITGTLAGLVNGETAGFSQSGTFDSANAGIRTVAVANTVAFTGSALADNYTLVNPTQSVAGQIDRATLTATNTAAASKTYDGNTTAAITGTLSGLVNGESLTFTQTGSFDSANAGARSVAVVNAVADNGATLASNYKLVNPTETVVGQIDKAPLTATVSAPGKTYDGSVAATPTLTITSGLVGNESVVISGATASFNSKDVLAAHTVTVDSVGLGDGSHGGLASNYQLSAGQTTAATIAPAQLTANASAADKTYDGNRSAVATLSIVSGLVGNETLGAAATASFNSKDVLSATTVTVDGVTLLDGGNGGLAGNYVLAPGQTAAARITPRLIDSATAVASNKVYDGNTSASALVSLAAGQLVGSETLGTTASAHFDSKDVATASRVTIDGVTLSDGANGGLASNYSYGAVLAPLAANITPRQLGATASATDKVYDGNRTAAATLSGISGLVGNETVGAAATASFNSKDVATASTVTVDGVTLSDGANGGLASNYALPPGQTATAHISPATLTVVDTAVAASKVYDGGVSAALTSQGRLLGVVANEAVGLTQQAAYLDKNVGNGKPVELHNSLSGAADVLGNYVVAAASTVQNFSADITPKVLDVIGTTAANKVFDGTTSAKVGGGVLGGVVAGDDVSLTQGGAFRDPVAGDNKLVDLDNRLAGIDAFNYVLPPMNTLADILPDLAARQVAESLKPSDTRVAALSARNDAGLQVTNLMAGALPGSLGAYVLAALPGAPAPVLAAASVNEEIVDVQLPPTAAGPVTAARQAFVPLPAPSDLLAAAGMISAEGGAQVNTRRTSAHRHVAPGHRAPLRKPAGAGQPEGGAVTQGLARFGAGVAGAASTLGSLAQAPAGGALRLPGDAAGAQGAAAVPAPLVQAPAVPQLTATPKPTPAGSGSGRTGAAVLGGLFAAAAGYTLGKRLLKRKRF